MCALGTTELREVCLQEKLRVRELVGFHLFVYFRRICFSVGSWSCHARGVVFFFFFFLLSVAVAACGLLYCEGV